MSATRRSVRLDVRCQLAERQEIHARAAEHGLSTARYVIQAALGQLQASNTTERLDDHQARIERLENALYAA